MIEIKNGLNDINNKQTEFEGIKGEINKIIDSQKELEISDTKNKINQLNEEIKNINKKLEEFKERYKNMKSLNIDLLLATLPDLPLKSENKDDMIKDKTCKSIKSRI